MLTKNEEAYTKSLKTNLVIAGALAIAIGGFSQAAFSQAADPVIGQWKTIDDKTGQARSIVKVEEVGGVLQGTIMQTFPNPNEKPLTHCNACTDHRKDQPIVGMKIMTGLKKDKAGHWSGGEILDPKEGKIYKVKVATEDGKKLEVRGFIGISLIGRTQTWVREQ